MTIDTNPTDKTAPQSTTAADALNVDPGEIDKFQGLARRWWDPDGDFRPLHDINPLRLGYIDRNVGLADKTVLDVGCGGGLLTEGMVQRGARVTGIDMADKPLAVARMHALEHELTIDYRQITVEQLAAGAKEKYDLVTCLEMLEHVPDPVSTIDACCDLLKPGGHLVLSTINRNPKAYLLAVLGAEYVLNLLPRGTHDYARFIKPSELGRWVREAGMTIQDCTGMTYNPLFRNYSLGGNTHVNYLVHAIRP